MGAAKIRVLCLDDQPENLKVRKFFLEQFGCEVITVTHSSACLQLLGQERFDLVLLDYHLAEEATGADVARKITALLPAMPLIMLTGDVKVAESVRQCVDRVLIKGSSGPADLLDAIQGLLPHNKIGPQRVQSLPATLSRIS